MTELKTTVTQNAYKGLKNYGFREELKRIGSILANRYIFWANIGLDSNTIES